MFTKRRANLAGATHRDGDAAHEHADLLAAARANPSECRRECVRLLEAIATITTAMHGMPETPAYARWIRYRADCYRRLAAAAAGDPITAAMSTGAAEADEHQAERINQQQGVNVE